MPMRNVELTDELDCFVKNRIESGQYGSANEVMRAGCAPSSAMNVSVK